MNLNLWLNSLAIHNYIKTRRNSRISIWFINKVNYILDQLNFWNKINKNNNKKHYKMIIDYKNYITKLNTSSIIMIIRSFLSKIWGYKSWSFKF